MSQMAAALLKVGLITKKQVESTEARKKFVASRIRDLEKNIRIINGDISKINETIALIKIVDPLGLKDPQGLKAKRDKLFTLVNKHIWELDKLNKEAGSGTSKR